MQQKKLLDITCQIIFHLHIKQNKLNDEQAKQIYDFFNRLKDGSYISKLNKIDGCNKLIYENKTTTLKLSTNLSYEQESILDKIKSQKEKKNVPSQDDGKYITTEPKTFPDEIE